MSYLQITCDSTSMHLCIHSKGNQNKLREVCLTFGIFMGDKTLIFVCSDCLLCLNYFYLISDNGCFMYYVMHSVKQLIAAARASNKTTCKVLFLKKGRGLKEVKKLSKAILNWVMVHYQLIHTQEKSHSWLTFPRDEKHNNESIKRSNGDNEKIGDECQCTDCRKDLLYILVWLLWEIMKLCEEHETKGTFNNNLHIINQG